MIERPTLMRTFNIDPLSYLEPGAPAPADDVLTDDAPRWIARARALPARPTPAIDQRTADVIGPPVSST